MTCTYNYDGNTFSSVNELFEYLRKQEIFAGTFSIFSLKNALQSASFDTIPANYKRNQGFLETGGPDGSYLVSSKTGRQVVAIYDAENRIKSEMKLWLEKHPMNKEGDSEYTTYYNLIQK
jgi:hypothetical protein